MISALRVRELESQVNAAQKEAIIAKKDLARVLKNLQ